MAVEQGFGVTGHEFVHGVQGGVYHDDLGAAAIVGGGGGSLSGLGGDGGGRVDVVGERFGLGLGGGSGAVEGIGDSLRGAEVDGLEKHVADTYTPEAAAEQGVGVAGEGLSELGLGAVPFATHAGGVVAEQGDTRMKQYGAALGAHDGDSLGYCLPTGEEVVTLDGAGLEAREALSERGGIHGAHLGAGGGDAPIVVLNQVEDGQPMQHRHLEGLGDFALGNGAVAERAKHDGHGAGSIEQALALAVL